MTHINNLLPILQSGGLWCDKKASAQGLCQQGIAHSHIKARRARRAVDVCQQGFLCDYVPFYFWYHSPMLLTISSGNVAGYQGGQQDVIYLVSDMETIRSAGLPFFFTDGHAEIAFSNYYEDPADFAKLDWTTIKAQQWADTVDDNDRKRRKQAEFLVSDFVPWDCITPIGTMTGAVKRLVESVLGSAGPPVVVRRNWYY